MNTDADNNIYEFEEKPKHPKSTKASMGIYIFTWEKLKKHLIDDEANPESENDFGKNIIPAFLNDGEKLVAWEFDGYWKDVGTIESLWEANMELLQEDSPIKLDDPFWKIYARSENERPHYIAPNASITDSYVTEGCSVYGKVEHSVLSNGAQIGKGAIIKDSIILPYAVIEEGAEVQYSIVGQYAHVGKGAKIGESRETCPKGKIAVVGDRIEISDGAVVEPGEMVGENR